MIRRKRQAALCYDGVSPGLVNACDEGFVRFGTFEGTDNWVLKICTSGFRVYKGS